MTDFEKRKYPTFKGDILESYEFCRKWNLEVGSERKPEHLELAALKDLLPLLARNKLHEVTSLARAWEIFMEIRKKLGLSSH